MRCPNCQTENPTNAHFCLNCGSTLIQHCPNCQGELSIGARYCKYCGQPVRGVTAEDEDRRARLAAAAPEFLTKKVRAAFAPGVKSVVSEESRVVTILVADVVASTDLAMQVGAKVWGVIVTKFFESITPLIYKYEGTIPRLLGDTLMAFYGAPVAHEDDPMRAVYAALDIRTAVQQLSKEYRDQYNIDFKARVCLSWGPVIIHSVDQNLKFDYKPVGEVINLATRLKFAAQALLDSSSGEDHREGVSGHAPEIICPIVIPAEVYHFIEPLFDCLDLGEIAVGTKQENTNDLSHLEKPVTTVPPDSIRIYQVLGRKTEPGPLRGITGLASPMVGRQVELGKLMQLGEALRAGLGRAVVISGEPGLGKSRLVAEWQQLLATASIASQPRSPLPQWAEGHCLSYGRGIAYHLVQDLLRSLLGLSENAGEEVTAAALKALVIDLFGELSTSNAAGLKSYQIYLYLGQILSLHFDDETRNAVAGFSNLHNDPQALQAQYLVALQQLVKGLASRRSVILVLEDLHWADPSSAELLGKLLPLATSTAVIFCLVTRAERDTYGWRLISTARDILGNGLTEIILEALSETESRTLVANLLVIEALPDEMRSLILDKAEGNPFYVEEVIRMLIEQGAIISYPNGRGWTAATDIHEVKIPDNLQSLMMARIDRLSDESKQTLRVASVVGRHFPVKVLEFVMDSQIAGSAVQARSSLSALESAGLLRVSRYEPDLEYLFRHTLVHEAAYSSILDSDRKQLHQVVGEAVEHLYPDRLAEFAAMLARHFDQAGKDEQALNYYFMAGETELASYANPEAEAHFRQALMQPGVIGQPDCESRRIQILNCLGEALYNQSRFQEAIQAWKQAIDLATSIELDPAFCYSSLAHLYARCGRAAWQAGDTPGSLQFCLEGMQVVTDRRVRDTQPLLQSVELARLLHETGRAYFFNGNQAQAVSLCKQALEMAERVGAVDVQADALATLGVMPNQPAAEALAALEKAITLAEENGLLSIAVRAYHNLGNRQKDLLGDNNNAKQNFLRAAEISRRRGAVREELFSLYSATGVALGSGKLMEVETTLPRLFQLAKKLPDSKPVEIELQLLQAAFLITRGDWDQGINIVHQNIGELRRMGDLQNLASAIDMLVTSYLEKNLYLYPEMSEPLDLTEAEQLLNEEIEMSDRGIGSRVGTRAVMGLLKAMQGKFADAHEFLAQAHSQAGDHPTINEQAVLLIGEGLSALREKNWDPALTAIESYIKLVDRLGQPMGTARARLATAEIYEGRSQPADLLLAESFLRQAAGSFSEIGAPVYQHIAERRLERLQTRTEIIMRSAQQVALELVQAGKIQSSFLPDHAPDLPGWGLEALLEPARQTSGDFYDYIPLPDGRLGILIADVTDKGAGAALFMASSRTLIRTFADQYADRPDQVIAATNRRLAQDTRGGLYVSAVYAVLDPKSGDLIFCNAGHNAPYLFSPQDGGNVHPLVATGRMIGMFEDTIWTSTRLKMNHGDCLVMYTDGVTEAQDIHGAEYTDERLIGTVKLALAQGLQSAQQIITSVIENVQLFRSGADISDDLTLVVLIRK